MLWLHADGEEQTTNTDVSHEAEIIRVIDLIQTFLDGFLCPNQATLYGCLTASVQSTSGTNR
jgi:hypothetical protein